MKQNFECEIMNFIRKLIKLVEGGNIPSCFVYQSLCTTSVIPTLVEMFAGCRSVSLHFPLVVYIIQKFCFIVLTKHHLIKEINKEWFPHLAE